MSTLNLRLASQQLRDAGHTTVRPDIVEKLIRGIARDGREDTEGIASFQVRKIDRQHLSLRLQRPWDKLTLTSRLRRKAAAVLLESLTNSAPANARGKDVQVATTLGALISALTSDLELAQEISDPSGLLDHALLWLHEQGAATLGRGLTIFRPAITVRLEPGSRKFVETDFQPLHIHYDEQTLQTHIMAVYAERGLDSMRDALRLMDDYFTLDRQALVEKWLPRSAAALRRQTTPESWRAILESLGNADQTRIVADDREQTSVLVLAGPGSGKTRVLVHRIAYLIRVRRQDPQGILALVYNRHAATEIRRRLFDLLGEDAQRMKAGHDIVVNRVRRKDRPGGELERLDPIGRGRVQVLRVPRDEAVQAVLAVRELERLKTQTTAWSWDKAAVIARTWRQLGPVRSYCEARGIPVQVASDDPPNVWRLRETQSLVDWLRARSGAAVRVADIAKWVERQPTGHWWSLLREGLDDLFHELGDREADRSDVIEWLAEWGRDARKRQTGLLLLSAHRAKGLEFDDVVVLDGGWDRPSNGGNGDAERRLYYVAMTRARRSLALLSMGARHPFIDSLEGPAVAHRAPDANGLDVADSNKIYRTLNPSEVDLGFAGRLAGGHRALRSLDRIPAGASVGLKQNGDRWLIVDRDGVSIGRLARKFAPPEGAAFVEGSAYAITMRFRSDSAEDFQSQLRRDRWSVVLPELVYRS